MRARRRGWKCHITSAWTARTSHVRAVNRTCFSSRSDCSCRLSSDLSSVCLGCRQTMSGCRRRTSGCRKRMLSCGRSCGSAATNCSSTETVTIRLRRSDLTRRIRGGVKSSVSSSVPEQSGVPHQSRGDGSRTSPAAAGGRPPKRSPRLTARKMSFRRTCLQRTAPSTIHAW